MSAIFCAVPAFRRVEPLMTSAPVASVMPISASAASGEPGLLAMPIVNAPHMRACWIAPSTYGVLPDAATQMTTSLSVGPRRCRSCAACGASSSAPSTETYIAGSPPAINARARSRGQLKVGVSSTLSSTPRRPLVPAPM